MRILALDIATKTGFAHGGSGAFPRSGSVRLKRPDEAHEVAAFNLHCFLRDRFEEWAPFGLLPDLVLVEHFLNPTAQPSADAVILQLQAHGAVQAFVRSWGILIVMVSPDVIRKHFIGVSRAKKTDPKGWIKQQVLARNVQLGYLEPTCRDLDRSDALALWDYGQAKFARSIPAELAMFS